MAAPDRTWSAQDLAQAEQVIKALAQQGYQKLPRYKSERSGDVFARMTNAENLAIFKNTSTPIESRLPAALEIQQHQNKLLEHYLAAFVKHEVRGADLLEIQSANLRASAALAELVDEFWPTLDPNDPTFEARKKGLQQMKSGLATQVAGSLLTAQERENYGTEDLRRYVESLEEILPTIVPRLLPTSQDETTATLDRLCDDPAASDLQPQLKRLREKVRAALK